MSDIRRYEPLWGSWYIDSPLGQGSFGKVYQIRKVEFGRAFYSALKVISIPHSLEEVRQAQEEGMSGASLRGYFHAQVSDILQEIDMMSRLSGNSNIVALEDHQVIEKRDAIGWDILIRMELLTSLRDDMARKTYSRADIVKMGVDICKALELCAQRKVIHRDIKPENIFVSDYGEYKLGDFGIARQIERTMAGLTKKGTYSYMAPEVFQGMEYGYTVDTYSLGIVMYRLLNRGRMPFLPDYPMDITPGDRDIALQRRMRGDIIPAVPGVDDALNHIMLKACAYHSRERFALASQMREALEALSAIAVRAGDTPVAVLPEPGTEPELSHHRNKTVGELDNSVSSSTVRNRRLGRTSGTIGMAASMPEQAAAREDSRAGQLRKAGFASGEYPLSGMEMNARPDSGHAEQARQAGRVPGEYPSDRPGTEARSDTGQSRQPRQTGQAGRIPGEYPSNRPGTEARLDTGQPRQAGLTGRVPGEYPSNCPGTEARSDVGQARQVGQSRQADRIPGEYPSGGSGMEARSDMGQSRQLGQARQLVQPRQAGRIPGEYPLSGAGRAAQAGAAARPGMQMPAQAKSGQAGHGRGDNPPKKKAKRAFLWMALPAAAALVIILLVLTRGGIQPAGETQEQQNAGVPAVVSVVPSDMPTPMTVAMLMATDMGGNMVEDESISVSASTDGGVLTGTPGSAVATTATFTPAGTPTSDPTGTSASSPTATPTAKPTASTTAKPTATLTATTKPTTAAATHAIPSEELVEPHKIGVEKTDDYYYSSEEDPGYKFHRVNHSGWINDHQYRFQWESTGFNPEGARFVRQTQIYLYTFLPVDSRTHCRFLEHNASSIFDVYTENNVNGSGRRYTTGIPHTFYLGGNGALICTDCAYVYGSNDFTRYAPPFDPSEADMVTDYSAEMAESSSPTE